jgi:hypothetical protein
MTPHYRAEAWVLGGFQGVEGMRKLFSLKDKGDQTLSTGTIATAIWVRGPQLPEDVEQDVLTAEDHRDLTLDHISRTSDLVARIEILKWS